MNVIAYYYIKSLKVPLHWKSYEQINIQKGSARSVFNWAKLLWKFSQITASLISFTNFCQYLTERSLSTSLDTNYIEMESKQGNKASVPFDWRTERSPHLGRSRSGHPGPYIAPGQAGTQASKLGDLGGQETSKPALATWVVSLPLPTDKASLCWNTGPHSGFLQPSVLRDGKVGPWCRTLRPAMFSQFRSSTGFMGMWCGHTGRCAQEVLGLVWLLAAECIGTVKNFIFELVFCKPRPVVVGEER